MSQTCPQCHAHKPPQSFYPGQETCRDCLRRQALDAGMHPDQHITAGMFRTTKPCTYCREDKPLESFTRDKRTKDGRTSTCKSCNNLRAKAWQQSEGGQAKLKAYKDSGATRRNRRRHYQRHKESIDLAAKTPERRRRMLAAVKRWRDKNKEKVKAYDAVRYRVRTGQMPPPTALSCPDCGQQATDYHHEDYAKPLDVIALCHSCHLIRHRK